MSKIKNEICCENCEHEENEALCHSYGPECNFMPKQVKTRCIACGCEDCVCAIVANCNAGYCSVCRRTSKSGGELPCCECVNGDKMDPGEPEDKVNHPKHYTAGKYEAIDILKDMLTPEQLEGFLIGNVSKYVLRYRHKNGLEDLKKAQWYLNKAVKELEEREQNATPCA